MIRPLALSLLVLAPALHADGNEADSVLAVYDLRSATPRYDEEGWAQSLLVPTVDRWDEQPFIGADEIGLDSSPDAIVEALTQVLGDELHYEGRSIELADGGRLVVYAPAEVQARVKALLAEFEMSFAGRIGLQIDIVDWADGPEPRHGSISIEEADRWLESPAAQGGERRRFHVGMSAGRTAVLDCTRKTPYVSEFDVEIAQSSFIHDPVIRDAEEGMFLLLRGVPDRDGLSLAVYYRDSRLVGPIESYDVSMRGLIASTEKGATWADASTKQQRARTLFRSAAFNTFLPTGRALAFATTFEHGNVSSRQLVILRKTSGDLRSFREIELARVRRKLVLVNTEVLSPPRLLLSGSFVGEERWMHGLPVLVSELEADSSLFLFELVATRFDSWMRMGPWALVTADPAWDGDAGVQIRELLDSRASDERLTTLSVALEGRGHGEASPVRFGLPVRSGTELGVMVGTLRNPLQDYDVEVAGHAAAADPVRRTIFEGLVGEYGVGNGAAGIPTVDVRALARLRKGGSVFDLGTATLGRVDLDVYEELHVSDRRRLDPSSAATPWILGDEGGSGGQPSLRLRIDVGG